ncbi:glycosyltransferase family 2 protein [Kovacikia minuta CCNUW1]|uniref:glycosyltransferase family 2 protein n=1 Tax=Kovacikia minuta TaxID=2931930 RepID=UPI001CCEDFA1|nr:glycosyltransferase family 2 protein [Kovacikia minuta]UBF29133.1 glycosyltransferase family 2 protein [Kovacikia minuta CCNUW1]
MIRDRTPIISIILVNYNGADIVGECLRSLEQFLQSYPYEVIVVDNASQDGSPDLIEHTFPWVQLLKQPENRGFGAGNNIAAKVARGEFLLLLNTDTQMTSDILPHLIRQIKDYPDVGIIGPQLLNPDGSLQLSTAWKISIVGEYQTLKQQKDYQEPKHQASITQKFKALQEVDIVVGAAFFIRKALFEQLGGFDENFFMYFEESDLCQRARNLGWKILYTPEISVIHIRGHSVNKVSDRMRLEYRKSQLYYYQKHRPLWEQLILRLYLLLKFLASALLRLDLNNLKFIALVLDFVTVQGVSDFYGSRRSACFRNNTSSSDRKVI